MKKTNSIVIAAILLCSSPAWAGAIITSTTQGSLNTPANNQSMSAVQASAITNTPVPSTSITTTQGGLNTAENNLAINAVQASTVTSTSTK